MNTKEIHKKITEGIKKYFSEHRIKKAVIGLSGGIDSSLSVKLVADAIGAKNVHGIIMPVKGLSSEENIKDAVDLCKLIGISHSIIYINEFIEDFEKLEWQSKMAKMNTASRIRAAILYHYANTHSALVIGTSNKTEIMLGYFTKYGDGAVDIEVIGDLFKTGELELARYLKIPENIIKKTPTAELYHGQTDEEELGASYKILDGILKLIEQRLSEKHIIENGFDKEIVNKVFEKSKLTEHKRRMPLVIKIS